MQFGTYRFQCRFEQDALLPQYKGSTFRGIFGRALKQVICSLKLRQCPDCLLKNDCLYPAVFEPHLLDNTGSAPPRPHPFVIQPPQSEQTFFAKGTAFDFNLLLFGAANQRLPYFVYAFDQMGRIGVGKKINGQRARYSLETIESSGKKIYSRIDGKLQDPSPGQKLNICAADGSCRDPSSVTLTFHTPLRLKHNNRFSSDLPFHVLTRAMLRRVSSLLACFDGGEPQLDYAGMVQRAQAVKITQNKLVWEDWQRYSLRRDEAMLMGGLKGSITYSGNLSEYLPLFEFCKKVHLGKQTTFGLGHFSAEAIQ